MAAQVLVRWTRNGGETFDGLIHPPFTTVRAAKAWARTPEATCQFPGEGEITVLTVEASTRPRLIPLVEWESEQSKAEAAEGGEA